MHEIKLPHSGISITFRAPKVKERREMLKSYQRELGFTPEEVLLAKCLTNIGNTTVEDIPSVPGDQEYGYLDMLDLYDFQYLMDVFATMFLIDEEGRKRAAEQGKQLMGDSGAATKSIKSAAPIK